MSGRLGSAPGKSTSPWDTSMTPLLSMSIPPAISQASFNPSPSESAQPDEHAGTGPKQIAPIPVSGTYSELFSSEISSVALREPARHGSEGVNVRLIVTLPPGATVTGRLKLSV